MGELDSEGLVPVFDAGSEFEALSIAAFLEQEGIEAAIRDLQIPMMDGIAMVDDPVWGQVLVLERDAARASGLIEEYIEATSDAGGPDPGGTEEDLGDDADDGDCGRGGHRG